MTLPQDGKTSSSAAPAPGGAAKAPPTKPRFRSRTGCWTCRRRKVKCDERGRTPDSVAYAGSLETHLGCKRCEDSGRPCLGYGATQPPRNIPVTPYHQTGYAVGPGNVPVAYTVHRPVVHSQPQPPVLLQQGIHPSQHHQYGPLPHQHPHGAQWAPHEMQHPSTMHPMQHHSSHPGYPPNPAILASHSGAMLDVRRNSAPAFSAWHAAGPGVESKPASDGPGSQGNSPGSSNGGGTGTSGPGTMDPHSRSGSVGEYGSRPHSREEAYVAAAAPRHSFSGHPNLAPLPPCGHPQHTYYTVDTRYGGWAPPHSAHHHRSHYSHEIARAHSLSGSVPVSSAGLRSAPISPGSTYLNANDHLGATAGGRTPPENQHGLSQAYEHHASPSRGHQSYENLNATNGSRSYGSDTSEFATGGLETIANANGRPNASPEQDELSPGAQTELRGPSCAASSGSASWMLAEGPPLSPSAGGTAPQSPNGAQGHNKLVEGTPPQTSEPTF